MARLVPFTGFPPPVTGQSIMSAQVARWASEVAEVVCVDTTAGRMSGGGVRHAARLARRWATLSHTLRPGDTVYLVLSSSRVGRLRDVVTVALARRRGARVVGHVQVGDFRQSLDRRGLAGVSRGMLARVETLIVPSERLVGDLNAWVEGSVRVVPNSAPGLDVTPADLDARRDARRGAPTLRVAMVANVLPGKGHGALLAGLAAYQARGPERPAEVDLLGAWPSRAQRDAFQARADGVELRVHGAVTDRGRLRDLLLASDVLVLPSRYRHEALPVSLIEGLATGTPVIGTRFRAIPDIVNDRTGRLLDDDRPETVARALEAFTDHGVWLRASRAASALYAERFAVGPVRSRLLAALGLD